MLVNVRELFYFLYKFSFCQLNSLESRFCFMRPHNCLMPLLKCPLAYIDFVRIPRECLRNILHS